jgi:hypothetical protein
MHRLTSRIKRLNFVGHQGNFKFLDKTRDGVYAHLCDQRREEVCVKAYRLKIIPEGKSLLGYSSCIFRDGIKWNLGARGGAVG